MSITDEEYLGDGLYAGYDGYQIWLAANDRVTGSPTDKVALDSSTARIFVHYYDKLRKEGKI